MGRDDNALVRKLHALEQRLRAVERGQRVAHGASIENAALEVRDDTGSLRAVVGQQPDGTSGVNVVNGPTPPAPSAPTVEPALAALAVTWDGTFADAQAAPLDWMRVEVHIGATAEFTPDQGTLRDTIESPQGGTVTIALPYTEWFVKLRSRTTSGVASDPTDAVAGTPRQADTPDILAGAITANLIDVDALNGKTITGSTIQTAASGQRIALESDSGEVRIYLPDGTVGAAVTPAGPDPWGIYTLPGFVAYDGSWYALLAEGRLTFGSDVQMFDETGVSAFPGTEPSLILTSGRKSGSTDDQARVTLKAGVGGAQPQFYATGDGGTLDFHVDGVFRAGNIAVGSVAITPSAPNTPTSVSVTGLNIEGTYLRAFTGIANPAPGYTSSSNGVTGTGYTNLTSTGLTVWATRQNTTPITVTWLVMGLNP